MSMAMMVAMASRKRDDRGRYMEVDNDRRMDGNYSRMNDEPEMRRKRDSRGRYMEDDGGNRMAYNGNQSRMEHDGNDMHYRPWPEPHIPPYLDRPDMRDDRRMEVPAHMRDKNIVHIRDYQDRRHIGFGANMDDDDEMQDYSRRAEYEPTGTMGGGLLWFDREKQKRMDGHQQAGGYESMEEDELEDEMTREKAEKIVSRMVGSDPAHPKGPRWKPDEVKPFAQKAGFPLTGEDFWEFFVVMNAMYSNYYEIAKKYGVSNPDYFADLAKAFIHDKDAKPGKVTRYFRYIPK